MVKIKKCKSVSFYAGKNWNFCQKFPEDATFNEYNTIIPISKCKDDFSSISSKKRLFSDSIPLLYRLNKLYPDKIGICTFFLSSAVRPGAAPGEPERTRRQDIIIMYAPPAVNPYKLLKRYRLVCTNFAHNTALIFQQFLWYHIIAKQGTRKSDFLPCFPGFPIFTKLI